MIEVDSSLGLMIWLINFIADKFGNNAILKGGMELRLLDCPRFTNDIDYVFIPFSSKKDVCKQFVDTLHNVPELKTEHTLNSKCLRCICTYNSMHVQIEINVAMECESQALTTATLARETNQQGRIIRGMRFDIALAHKIAAWNERGLIRDLYDCYFMTEILSVQPDISTIKQRLSKSEIRVGNKTRKVSMKIADLVIKLQTTLSGLTQTMVEEQMKDYMSPIELPGLEKKIRIGITRLLQILNEVD